MENVFLICLIPTFWVALFLYLKSKNPYENRSNILKTKETHLSIIVTITVYILLNLALGSFLSYGENPYSPKAALYLWEYTFPIFFQEYVRFLMISNNKGSVSKIALITALFIFVGADPQYLLSNFNSDGVTRYVVYILMPVILENILFSYFARTYDSGYWLSSVYKIFLELYVFAVPIYPNLQETPTLLLRIMLIFIVFFQTVTTNPKVKPPKNINKEYAKSSRYKASKGDNRVFYAVIFSVSAAVITFTSGITGYFPVAIASNSMHGTIEIGDLVVVEKIDSNCASTTLKENDVLIYKLDSILVVHRIIEIGRSPLNSEIYYITKGDNNSGPDSAPVRLSQVVGIAKCKLPYVGYPSVILEKYLI